MSGYPPYDSGNPYVPPNQYPSQSGYPSPDQQSQYVYPQPNAYPPAAYPQQVYMPPAQYVGVNVQVGPVYDPGAGQALTGMILGIIGLVFPFLGLVPLFGLVFSIIGMKSVTRKGMAIAGLVMSIIGIVFALCTLAWVLSFFAAMGAGSYSGY